MRTVAVSITGAAYSIYVGAAARAHLRRLIRQLPGVGRVAVVTDETVARLHLDSLLIGLRPRPAVIRFAPGEHSKSLAMAERLYDRLAEARIGRDDLLVTFGGGVVGDLGGFVAATWLRGIRFIQVPTTLEADVDASVGGKTGVNHAAGKNLIGAFHQPSAVVIDTEFLHTLAERDYVAGLAESVKHGVIRDGAFFAWQESNVDAINGRAPDALEQLIARNCEIKADVVARDERERNLRAILNYGHTIGHALEHNLGYELRHGECVALGMIVENELSCARGWLARPAADRIAALLAKLKLPTRLPRRVPAEEIIDATAMDKKVRGTTVNYVLVRDFEAPERVVDIAEQEVAAALHVIQSS